jgi:uridine kinase
MPLRTLTRTISQPRSMSMLSTGPTSIIPALLKHKSQRPNLSMAAESIAVESEASRKSPGTTATGLPSWDDNSLNFLAERPERTRRQPASDKAFATAAPNSTGGTRNHPNPVSDSIFHSNLLLITSDRFWKRTSLNFPQGRLSLLMDLGKQTMVELAAEILASAEACPRALVGIDGPGGSGKSTLAAQLVDALGKAFLVHSDDFYLPSARQDERLGEVGPLFDLPRLLEQVVAPAATGSAVRYQRYDWAKDELAEWIDIPSGASVIIEGVYSLSIALRWAYTYKIWCRADAGLRLARGVERDGEIARPQWLNVWMPQEDDYAARQNPEAASDLVLDSSCDQGASQAFRVVKGL